MSDEYCRTYVEPMKMLCRVPDGMHSANILALGKSAVSGSAHSFQMYTCVVKLSGFHNG